MKRRTARLLGLLSAGTLMASPLALSPLAAQRVEVGNAASVVGDVKLRENGEGKAAEVERKDRIAWGDLITTGKKSQLQILLLDRSMFGLGARTQLVVDEYVYDPNAGRSLIATFLKGALRFFSGRQEGDNSAEVRTPAGRIGVRGTAVDMLVGERAEKIAEEEDAVGRVDSDEDEATFVVLRGPGAATAGGLTPGLVEVEGAGVVVTLDEPGLAAYIPRAGAAPIGPFRISNKGLARVQDRLAPEVARAAKGGGLLKTLIPVAVGAIAIGTLLDGNGGNERPTGQPANSTNNNPNNNQQFRPINRPGSTSQTSGSTNQSSNNNPRDPNRPR